MERSRSSFVIFTDMRITCITENSVQGDGFLDNVWNIRSSKDIFIVMKEDRKELFLT